MTNKKYGTNRGSGKIVDLVVILVDLLEILVGDLLGSWWIFWDLGGSFGDLAGSFGDLGGSFGNLARSFGDLGRCWWIFWRSLEILVDLLGECFLEGMQQHPVLSCKK